MVTRRFVWRALCARPTRVPHTHKTRTNIRTPCAFASPPLAHNIFPHFSPKSFQPDVAAVTAADTDMETEHHAMCASDDDVSRRSAMSLAFTGLAATIAANVVLPLGPARAADTAKVVAVPFKAYEVTADSSEESIEAAKALKASGARLYGAFGWGGGGLYNCRIEVDPELELASAAWFQWTRTQPLDLILNASTSCAGRCARYVWVRELQQAEGGAGQAGDAVHRLRGVLPQRRVPKLARPRRRH